MPQLRTTDAFARGGAVRYAHSFELEQRVRDALADANGHEAAAVRAARVFLDICFMHPFADGNGRAARLALDHVLTARGSDFTRPSRCSRSRVQPTMIREHSGSRI